jgi:hypothetical protein
MAERLRRETRNLLGFPRAGSNPADVVIFLPGAIVTSIGEIFCTCGNFLQ